VGKTLKTVAIIAAAVAVAVFAPQIAPIFLSASATAATTAATVATITAIGASIALSTASMALFGPKVPKTQLSRLSVSLDPSTPRKAVFGTTAMPLDLRYHESSGTDQEYVDYIVAVAAHKVGSIDEIWFEEKQAWTATGGVTGTYAGYLTVTTRTEGSAANYISINGGGKWGSSRRLTGCAYVHLRIKRTGNTKKAESPLASGLPSRVTIIGDGARLYDPRKDSTVPGGSGSHRATDQATWGAYTDADDTDNPALQLLWWLIGWQINGKLSVGCGVPYNRIDMASFITAANICDENVTLAIGGTQKRYRSSGTASDADDRLDIINNLLVCMNGTLRDNGGKLTVTAMKNDLANYVLTFNENDMLGGFDWQQTRGLTENYNIVRGRYVDPSPNSLYQMVDYPEIELAVADGIERVMSLDLPYIEDGRRAQRIAKQVFQRNQYRGMFSTTFNAKALGCQVGDVVRINLEALGWTNKLFRVVSQEIRFDGQVPMALVEENAAIYAWDAEDVAPITPTAPTIYNPLNNPFILGLAEAEAIADGKIDSYYQAAAPTGASEGDYWTDTDDANKLYRYTSGAWVLIRDTGIPAAITAAAGAQATADGKVTTFYVENTPTATAVGDLWYKPSTKYLTRWNGSAWADVATVGAQAGANLLDSAGTVLTDTAIKNTEQLWSDVDGVGRPQDNANNTFVDANGLIQGVSSGGGTEVRNSVTEARQGRFQWQTDKYATTSVINPAGTVPSYNLVNRASLVRSVLVPNTSTSFTFSDDNYFGVASASVFSPSAWTWNVTVTHDDAGRIYVNGQSVYSNQIGTYATSITFPAGWSTVELMWAEQAGGDAFTLSQAISARTEITDMWAGTNLTGLVSAASNTANWPDVIGTGRPENNATVGATAGTNLKDSGGTVLSDGNVRNSDMRVAVDTAGTGGRARARLFRDEGVTIINEVELPSVVQNKDQIWADISGTGIPDDYADVTSENTAAAISGQGPGATAAANRVLNDRYEGLVRTIAQPDGGQYYTGDGLSTGQLQIAMPFGGTANGMISFELNIYDYNTDKTVKYIIGGYHYMNGSNPWWVNVSAQYFGPRGFSRPVKFGSSSSKGHIWIGNVGDTWNYSVISIKNLQVGYRGQDLSWESGWALSLNNSDISGSVIASVATPRAGDQVFGEGLFEVSNGAVATLPNFKTAQGTAAAIAGQGSLATSNTADWASQIASRPVELTDGRITNGFNNQGRLRSGIQLDASSAFTPAIEVVGALKGTNLNKNPEFFGNSLAGYSVYNNNGDGSVNLASRYDATVPNGSGYAMEVNYTGGNPTPGYGGFTISLAGTFGQSRPGYYTQNATIYYYFWAVIPAGRRLEFHTNAYGDGGTWEWVSDTAGTGGWKKYIGKQVTGIGGTLSITGYFAVHDGPNTPFTWVVGKLDVMDVSAVPKSFLGNGNLYEQDGGYRLTNANSITSFGTAAAISGQGALATRNDVTDSQLGSTLAARVAPFSGDQNYLSAGRVAWDVTGSTVQSLKPAEAGANVTESRTAAAIASQGYFATRNYVFGGGPGTLGDGRLINEDNTRYITDAGYYTPVGTAAAIAGQGGFATRSSASYGDGSLLGFDYLATRERIQLGNGSGNARLADENNNYWVTNALAITSLGTSAAIAGQAATATNSDYSAVTGTTKPDNNATVGAVAGTNLRDSGGRTLTDSDVSNTSQRVAVRQWAFNNGSLNGWTGVAHSGASPTVTAGTQFVTFTANSGDCSFNSPDQIGVNGQIGRYLRLMLSATAQLSAGMRDVEIYFSTNAYAAIDGSRSKNGTWIPSNHPTDGTPFEVLLDMHNLTFGGNAWRDETVRQLRIDFDPSGGGFPESIRIHEISIVYLGTATVGAPVGSPVGAYADASQIAPAITSAATTANWPNVTGTGKPSDNANNTSVDANGAIQGVSSGANTVVDNARVLVGARNLMINSGQFTAIPDWSSNGAAVTLDSTVLYGSYNTLKVVGFGGAQKNTVMRLKANTQYTISAMVKGSAALAGGGDTTLHIQSWRDEDTGNVHQETTLAADTAVTTSWKLITQTFVTPNSANLTYCRFYFYPLAAGFTLNVGYVKLEEGNKATDWTQAPEEITAGINTALQAFSFTQDGTPSATFIGQTWYKPTSREWYYSTGTGTGSWQRILGDMSALNENTRVAIVSAAGYFASNNYSHTPSVPSIITSYTFVPVSTESKIQITVFGYIDNVDSDDAASTMYGRVFINGSAVGNEQIVAYGNQGVIRNYSFNVPQTSYSGTTLVEARFARSGTANSFPGCSATIMIEEFLQ